MWLDDFDEVGVESLEFVTGQWKLVLSLTGSGYSGGVNVLFLVLDDLGEDLPGGIGERNHVVGAIVLDQVFDCLRLNGDGFLHLEHIFVGVSEDDLLAGVLWPRHH